LPVGKEIAVNTSFIKAEKVKTSWFNPRNGETSGIRVLKRETTMRFIPPTTGLENDWVLIIERN
jgi:hypothetical protein